MEGFSSDAIVEFKAACSEEFPTDKISDDELHIRAISVLSLFALLQPSVADEESRILASAQKHMSSGAISLRTGRGRDPRPQVVLLWHADRRSLY